MHDPPDVEALEHTWFQVVDVVAACSSRYDGGSTPDMASDVLHDTVYETMPVAGTDTLPDGFVLSTPMLDEEASQALASLRKSRPSAHVQTEASSLNQPC